MDLCVRSVNGLPECDGWIEKFSVGRGVFSTRKWCKRYAVVTRAGIGYMHHESPSALSNPSKARCFIPFEGSRRRSGEVQLRPVFLLRHVTALMHHEAPATDNNYALSSCVSGDTGSVHPDVNQPAGYYFALSFEESGKRLFLLLRTSTVENYLIWTSILSLYVSAGSKNTLVPVAHPLEMQRYRNVGLSRQLSGFFFFRQNAQINPSDVNALLYVKDPDPCAPHELSKVRKYVLEWDEGERERLIHQFGGGQKLDNIIARQAKNEEDLLHLTAELDDACDNDVEFFEQTESLLPAILDE